MSCLQYGMCGVAVYLSLECCLSQRVALDGGMT